MEGSSGRQKADFPSGPFHRTDVAMIAAPPLRSLNAAISWVIGSTSCLPAESAPPVSVCDRVLAQEVRAAQPIPIVDRAAIDGFAVAAAETVGATSYNSFRLPLRVVSAGHDLPEGTDAVIPLGAGQSQPPDAVECVEAVAPGENVQVRESVAAPGTLLVPAGTRLSPPHIGMLIAAGLATVEVIRRPMVKIMVCPPSGTTDSNGPMTRTLVERDGGVVTDIVTVERTRQGIYSALGADGGDLMLVVGGTGPGADDCAAAALAEAGELVIHGVLLRPGETSGLGRTRNGVPVVLLPGSPAACLFSYEMLAGRAVRRLGGRDSGLPYRSRVMRMARKIVSTIGIIEICPVRYAGTDVVEPLPSFGETGLMAAVAADGFVIVPEATEGYPQAASVMVYLYERTLSVDRER